MQQRSYTYNNGNELLNYDGLSFQYDANGNMASKTNQCGTTIYQYDSENRLIGINGFTNDCSLFTVNYKYDPFGRRIEKSITDIATGTVTTTRYVYDREDILFELDGSGNIVTEYLHGPGIDEPIAMIKGGQTYYYHADGLGSIIAITDSSGSVVQRYEYNSFGEITYQQDPNFKQPYTYTGREYDEESGLYYYRARYYDAKMGRFITQDPIGFWGGINFYRYAFNNPLYWIDPSGLKPGDSYPTQDTAAIDAVSDINPTSISQGKEYGGYIYQKPDGSYSYTPPTGGTKDSVDLGPTPSNGKTTGDYHTHGANDPGYKNEDFSPADKTGYSGDYSTGYLGTPSGTIKKYDSKTGNITDITPKKKKCK